MSAVKVMSDMAVSRRTLLAVVLAGAPTLAHSSNSVDVDARSRAIVARIQRPRIPKRDFPVRLSDGAPGADHSADLARALAACEAAGGGRVVLPQGVCRTGPIRLASRTELHVPAGAKLQFIPEPERYLPPVLTRWEGVELMGYQPLIYAYGAEDIAVTGGGVIDGGADDKHWWPWKGSWSGRYKDLPIAETQKGDRARLFEMAEQGVAPEARVFGAGSRLRPSFFQPYRSRRVLVEGVTFNSAPFWQLHPVECTDVTIRGVTCASHGPNNDGIDPEACRDVLIEHCVLDTGDDCIALKSGRNADGRRLGILCENVVIRKCRMKDGHAGVAIGSELSGGVRNVFVSDCQMDSPDLTRALVIKTNSYRGGVVRDIHLDRLSVGVIDKAFIQVWMHYEEGDGGPFTPVIESVSVSNCRVERTERVLVVRGLPRSPIRGLALRNIVVKSEEARSVVVDAADVVVDGVVVEGRAWSGSDLVGFASLDGVTCDKWAVCR